MSVNSQVKFVPGTLPEAAFQPESASSRSSKRKSLADAQSENSLLGSWSTSTYIWIIVVPVVVYIMLLMLVPTFVLKDANGTSQVDHRQMLLWTLIISAILWVMLWGMNYCKSC